MEKLNIDVYFEFLLLLLLLYCCFVLQAPYTFWNALFQSASTF